MTLQNSKHKLPPRVPRLTQIIRPDSTPPSRTPEKSHEFTALFLIVFVLSIVVALTGCSETVLVKPCPTLPEPPQDLMQTPKNLPLVPEHLRPSASRLNAMPQPMRSN